MDTCDELFQVNLVKVSWIQRFLPLNISPDTFLHMDTCDELIQVNLVKVSWIQRFFPLNVSPDTFLHMDPCDELIQVFLVKESQIQSGTHRRLQMFSERCFPRAVSISGIKLSTNRAAISA